MHAAIVRTDGSVTFVESKPEGIDAIQAAVGGWFACVGTPHADVFVDDEGLLVGKPINLIASVIAGQPLVGDAWVCGPSDRNGDSTPIMPRLVELLRRDCVERPA